MVLDVWSELRQVFESEVADLYPGIKVHGLDYQSQKTILDYIFDNVADVDPMLEDIETGDELYSPTLDSLIHHMLSEDVDGLVWVGVKIDGLTLPPLGLFTPNYSSLSIHYIMGMWSPVTLIALFECLRWINDVSDHLQIKMEQDTAPKYLCKQFDKTWKNYLKDKRC